ncbi:MAG: thiamine pyrophosphate-dependent enzyme [Planctomycetota bacterium]
MKPPHHKVYEGIPDEDVIRRGHFSCPGCGASLSMKLVLKVLGKKVLAAVPACCWSVCDGPFPYSATGIPIVHCAFESAAATASGIRAALNARGITDTTVMAWAGDGGTFDIGIQALSGAAERNNDILYVCYDNEAYMNTGIQRSSATPMSAWTTTTPPSAMPKTQPKKNLGEIIVAHRVPYFATATVAYPDDLMAKFQKAKDTKGFRMVHILSPCPVGWRSEERLSIQLSRLAVQTRIFPLYEVENGVDWKLTQDPPQRPVEEYLTKQGRFKHLKPQEIAEIQQRVDKEWELLERRFAAMPSTTD